MPIQVRCWSLKREEMAIQAEMFNQGCCWAWRRPLEIALTRTGGGQVVEFVLEKEQAAMNMRWKLKRTTRNMR